MDSLACSYSARFDAPGVFACIPDWCTAPPDLNGARLPVAVADWQWLAPEQTGEAGILEFVRAPSQSLSEKRYLRPLRDRQTDVVIDVQSSVGVNNRLLTALEVARLNLIFTS